MASIMKLCWNCLEHVAVSCSSKDVTKWWSLNSWGFYFFHVWNLERHSGGFFLLQGWKFPSFHLIEQKPLTLQKHSGVTVQLQQNVCVSIWEFINISGPLVFGLCPECNISTSQSWSCCLFPLYVHIPSLCSYIIFCHVFAFEVTLGINFKTISCC